MLFLLVFLNENAQDDTVEQWNLSWATIQNVDNTGSGRLQESNYRSDSFEKGSSNIYLIIFFACDMRNSMFSLKVLCILLVT